MPFDSRPEVQIDVAPIPAAVEAIDKMIVLLGSEGERWIQGHYGHMGRFCLVGAMYATNTLGLALPLVNRAIGRGEVISDAAIVAFNDNYGRTFADIRAVLLKARDLACWEASNAV